MQEYLLDFDRELTPEQRAQLRATPACQRYVFERARVGKLAERTLEAGGALTDPMISKQAAALLPLEAALRSEVTRITGRAPAVEKRF